MSENTFRERSSRNRLCARWCVAVSRGIRQRNQAGIAKPSRSTSMNCVMINEVPLPSRRLRRMPQQLISNIMGRLVRHRFASRKGQSRWKRAGMSRARWCGGQPQRCHRRCAATLPAKSANDATQASTPPSPSGGDPRRHDLPDLDALPRAPDQSTFGEHFEEWVIAEHLHSWTRLALIGSIRSTEGSTWQRSKPLQTMPASTSSWQPLTNDQRRTGAGTVHSDARQSRVREPVIFRASVVA